MRHVLLFVRLEIAIKAARTPLCTFFLLTPLRWLLSSMKRCIVTGRGALVLDAFIAPKGAFAAPLSRRGLTVPVLWIPPGAAAFSGWRPIPTAPVG